MSDSRRRPNGELDSPDEGEESSPLRVSLTVADRETLLEMMAAIEEREVPVRTEDIFRLSLHDTETATLDLKKLTEKQRETLEIALRTGYYEQPRGANLADLAAEIGVSKSAVSQRLRSAEAKIIKNAFGEYR
jgi:predicted DNA binding protein